MNVAPATRILRHPLPGAVLGALLLTVAFPNFNLAGLAWIGPGVVLCAGLLRPESAFRTGYVAGLVLHLTSLCWLLNIPVTFAPILGWVALSAFLALFPATWLWLCTRLATDARTQTSGSSPLALHTSSLLWPLQCAAAWVALEMFQARIFTGFPWNQLGVSQWRQIPLVQLASLTGVAGLSFLIVWTSASLLAAVLAFFRAGGKSSRWRLSVLPPLVAVAAVVAFGTHRVLHAPEPTRFLNVAAVQPSIPQTLIWSGAADTNRFARLLALLELPYAKPPDLFLLPESALPGMLRYDDQFTLPLLDFVKRRHVWLITSSTDATPKRGSTDPKAADFFNSAFLIAPDGVIAGKYDKRRLVIFGEYIPLVRWLPFLRWFTPIGDGFESGRSAEIFEMNSLRAKTSVLICFEDMFAPLAREAAADDVDFLVNLTNDGWFGEAAEQWQHAAGAVFRAVENNLPLVRACNNGVTCWIDAQGRLRDPLRDANGRVYGEGTSVMSIPLLNEGERRAPTLYHRLGDWFGWACVGLTALALARILAARRSKKFN
ncbi:MAG: apolipoprotein N-acyltransferase [Verrucomicrobia bacterium]|nr:apolipoprotein N-acyltransferase [Verrucomicrobiota bacterium]